MKKMKFRLSILSAFLAFCLVFPPSALADAFELKTISNLNVEGLTYSQLWYTNGNVTFTGSATPNATVTATVDSTSETVTADAAGSWSYTTSLAEGDHQVSFVSDGNTISFTLTIGTPAENIGSSSSATTTPTSGVATPLLMLVVLGTGFTGLAGLMWQKNLLKIKD